RARQQRTLHRVRELLLLLVEPGVVDREGSLSGNRGRLLDRFLRHGRTRLHRENRQRGQDFRRGRDRKDRGGPTALEEREERCCRRPDLGHGLDGDRERLAQTEQTLDRESSERLWA